MALLEDSTWYGDLEVTMTLAKSRGDVMWHWMMWPPGGAIGYVKSKVTEGSTCIVG